MKKILIIILLAAIDCQAQELPPVLQQQLEQRAEFDEATEDDDPDLQQLEYFKKHPLDLNLALKEDILLLHLVSEIQAEQLILYRKFAGDLVDIHELQAIPFWDPVTIRKILTFVKVQTTNKNIGSVSKGDHSLLLRLSRKLENEKTNPAIASYKGNMNHILFRYRFQFKNELYFGITGDKDAGEEFFNGARSKGFDFYSAHFFLRRKGFLKTIAIGDYTLNLGQGLIQWQSLGLGKGSETMFIKRSSEIILPYRSSGEFNFMRGVAIGFKIKKIEGSIFISLKKISAHSDSAGMITSLNRSGLFRTDSEIKDRNKISQFSAGGNLSYQTESFKISLHALMHRFDHPFRKNEEAYQLFAFSGRQLFHSGIDFSYTRNNMHFFGEAAMDQHFHPAFLGGILISVDPRIDLSFLFRNIRRDYSSLFGNAFTENYLPVNENGVYAGIAFRPAPGWELHAYADLFRFPWIRYRINAPSSGSDYLLHLNYKPSRQSEMYLRYRYRSKPINGKEGIILFPVNQIKKSLRLHFVQQFSRKLSLKSRIEVLGLKEKDVDPENGFLGFIEISNQLLNKLNADLRIQFFESSSYNSRIYVYDSDVSSSFSIPAFYEKGFRYYLNFACKLTTNFTCWLRWSETIHPKPGKVIFPSNMNSGVRNREFKVQVMFGF
jgi:hypothetical protein